MAELCESHIIPKFFFRWLKKTGTPYIRSPGEPNRRVQDGHKPHMLCSTCEGKFSTVETWFSEEIFRPYLDDVTAALPYDRRLYYYSISLLWRALHWQLPQLPRGEWFFDHFRPQLSIAESQWREFLLSGKQPPTYSEVHLFMTDVGLKGDVKPTAAFNQFAARASDMSVVCSKSRCFMYVKYARFIWFGLITPNSLEAAEYRNTLVLPAGGSVDRPQELRQPAFGNFLVDRARVAAEAYQRGLSPDQQARITRDEAARGGETSFGEDLAACLAADRGSQTVPWLPLGRVGRNERCPCGSGQKYKRCHGQ